MAPRNTVSTAGENTAIEVCMILPRRPVAMVVWHWMVHLGHHVVHQVLHKVKHAVPQLVRRHHQPSKLQLLRVLTREKNIRATRNKTEQKNTPPPRRSGKGVELEKQVF